MTEFDWLELRERAVELYVDTPSAALEERIVAIFEKRPALVADAIDHVAERFQRGLVRSPWAVLAKHAETLAAGSDRAVKATDESERDEKVARAEAWVKTAGLHFDRPSEIVEELFGDRGPLKTWATDSDLVARMVELWNEQRPRGEQVEREAEQRGRAYADWRRKLHAAKPPPEPEPIPAAVAEALEL